MDIFDYVVAGAGSAGCVVANRLAASGQFRVLLLEAGPGDANPMVHMPGGGVQMLKSNTYNWQYYSTPQKHCGNKRFYVPRGRLVGGSSNINGMVCIRGNPADYDAWSDAGNVGWSFRDVLPHFKNIENYSDGENAYHGSKGELPVNPAPSRNILFDKFIEAGQEVGLPLNRDFNGASQEGVGRFHANIEKGRRWGAGTAFIKPIRTRKNFRLITGATINRVIFDNGVATAVEVENANRILRFSAAREIVLCLGTINTPKLLQLSGVGDSQALSRLGFEPVHHLPAVGENLREHLGVYLGFGCSQPITLNGVSASLWKSAAVGLEYLLFRTGIAAGNQVEAGGFWRSKDSLSLPDIQMHFIPSLMNGLTGNIPSRHGVTFRACNLQPHSSGSVRLASANPKYPPAIDFNFLADERDKAVMLAIYRFMHKLMSAKAWDGLIQEEVKGLHACLGDEEALDALSQHAETDYHPVGTCKMGQGKDSVVDERLRIRGLKNIRIADVSIMPTHIRGNTNLPAMMIGDKASAMILADNA